MNKIDTDGLDVAVTVKNGDQTTLQQVLGLDNKLVGESNPADPAGLLGLGHLLYFRWHA